MIAPRRFKDSIYEQLARIGKAAASPKRLELLDLLAQGPRTVEVLASQMGQSLANVSQHLQVLRGARLVESQKDGLYVTYRLADDGVGSFLLALRRLAESRLVEIEHVMRGFLEEREELEPVDREALVKRIRRGEVTLLDVRPAGEFHAGHIPGALSVPTEDLKRRLSSLPKSREVVAYCRGPYCVYAVDAVKVLRARGFKAHRLDEGVLEWRARGLPIEASSPKEAS
jgi:rhodanese-related sulfurtransferase